MPLPFDRDSFRRLRSEPTWVAVAALAAVLLPAVVFGPWLPLHDLVAFVGLDTFPAEKSYGPLHFVPLQFTYVLHVVLSRAMTALGIPASVQIVIFYGVQAATFVVVLWRVLVKVVPQPRVAGWALAAGALGFWEGQFLWGGPLPCSLAAALWSVALLMTLAEVERSERTTGWLVALLTGLSLVSHPFALPFALGLMVVRFAVLPARRWQSAGVAAALLLLGWVILRDSPGGEATGQGLGRALWTFEFDRPWKRLTELFIVDAWTVRYVFGEVPVVLHGYLLLLGAVRLVGFAVAPWVAWVARDRPVLRTLAAVNAVAGFAYLFTPGLEAVLPWWPQRILAFCGPFSIATAVAGSWYLVQRWRRAPGVTERAEPRWGWLIPLAALTVLVAVQVPILRLSGEVRRNFEQVRREILASGVKNALLVTRDLQTVQPRYLRCVSFLLFSDPQIVGRGLLLFTEWHVQDRHPTRLVERWFELGRRQHQAVFSSDATGLHVKIVPLAPGELAQPVGNNEAGPLAIAEWDARLGDWLLGGGHLRDAVAHYRAALRLVPDHADIRQSLGVALVGMGEWAGAVAEFEIVARARPASAVVRANLGYALLRAGRTPEAIPQLREALRLDPAQVLARQSLALAGVEP